MLIDQWILGDPIFIQTHIPGRSDFTMWASGNEPKLRGKKVAEKSIKVSPNSHVSTELSKFKNGTTR